MLHHEGDRFRIEPSIQRVEHCAGHWHAVVRLDHRRRVGKHRRDGIAATDAALLECVRKSARARIHLAPAVAQCASAASVYHGRKIREHCRAAFDKTQRRERGIVGRVALKSGVEDRVRHSAFHQVSAGGAQARLTLTDRAQACTSSTHAAPRSAPGSSGARRRFVPVRSSCSRPPEN